MRAVILPEIGDSSKLQYTDSQPLPKLQDGQVLIKNKFSGINYIDTYFRSGLYPSPTGYPLILGQEGAGTVAAVEGSNKVGLKEGDRVVWIKQGGYAEYTAVAAERVIKIPDGLSEDQAVGGFLMGMTALSLIREAYPVKKDDKVLVHAAAGGVGLLLCQLLKLAGAYTIGTAGSAEKCKTAERHGADTTIDYNANKDWADKVKELTNGQGVDVVYDSVGKTTWEGSLDAVKRKGKVVYFGNASGPVPPIQIQRLAPKNISIMRATVMSYIVTREELEYYSAEVLNMIKDGKLKINVHEAYDLKDAKRAQDDMEGRKTSGKLLLKL